VAFILYFVFACFVFVCFSFLFVLFLLVHSLVLLLSLVVLTSVLSLFVPIVRFSPRFSFGLSPELVFVLFYF
jgi:hypothetical protein